jgi:hypothetical protein
MKPAWYLLIAIAVLACHKDNEISGTPEMLIIDSLITTTVDDHGFVNFSPPVNLGTDWSSPYDFFNGSFYYRFEIIDYPSQDPFLINLCIWSDVIGNWESWNETCTTQLPVEGKGVFTGQSSPSSWWFSKQPVDFSRVCDFDHLGLALWCANYKNLSDWIPASNSCWDQNVKILPLTLRLSIVAVAKGYTFSGWEAYIE